MALRALNSVGKAVDPHSFFGGSGSSVTNVEKNSLWRVFCGKQKNALYSEKKTWSWSKIALKILINCTQKTVSLHFSVLIFKFFPTGSVFRREIECRSGSTALTLGHLLMWSFLCSCYLLQSPAYYPAPVAVYEGPGGEEPARPAAPASATHPSSPAALQLRRPPAGRGADRSRPTNGRWWAKFLW